MRRLFIIRKDLQLEPGKLAAMVGHCAEGYWTRLISKHAVNNNDGTYTVSFMFDGDIMDKYINDIFTKTICEAKNLNQLTKAVDIAKGLGLVENVDYGFIDDCCKTDLTPEFTDENGVGRCRVGIWFRPLDDEIAHIISKKFKLYRD